MPFTGEVRQYPRINQHRLTPNCLMIGPVISCDDEGRLRSRNVKNRNIGLNSASMAHLSYNRGCTRIKQTGCQFPGSSTVEHSAVNRRVASSNLARGAILPPEFQNFRHSSRQQHKISRNVIRGAGYNRACRNVTHCLMQRKITCRHSNAHRRLAPHIEHRVKSRFNIHRDVL